MKMNKPQQLVLTYFFALVLAVGALGAGLMATLSAPVVRIVAQQSYDKLDTDILEDRLRAAETTRRYVASDTPDERQLRATTDGFATYDDASISHLRDVRGVIFVSRVIAWMAIVIGILAISGLVRRKRWGIAAKTFGSACLFVIVPLAVSALILATNFETAFTVFHSWFFADGTWQFAPDSLLITSFPLNFWMMAAGVWVATTTIIGLIFGTLWLFLRQKGR